MLLMAINGNWLLLMAIISKSGTDYSDYSFWKRLFRLFFGLFRLFLCMIGMDYSGLFLLLFFWIIPIIPFGLFQLFFLV